MIHVELFRCIVLGNGTMDASTAGLLTVWHDHETVEFDIEALIGDEVSDARRFRVENFIKWVNGIPGIYPWPTVTEIGPVS